MFEEFYRETSQKYSRIYGTIALVLIGFCCCFLYALGGLNWLFILLLILAALMSFALFFFHKLMAASTYKHTLKMHGGSVQRTTIRFTEEEITMTEGEYFLALDYDKIEKIVVSNHLISLMFGAANGVIVKRDGFSHGDPNAFLAFIERKSGKKAKQ